MREMKNSGIEWIGQIPSDWDVVRLKYFISGYKAGPFGSALITDNLNTDGSILVYTPEHVAKKSAEIDNNLFLPDERHEEMSQFIVEPGDIIFPIVGSLGRAMLISKDMPTGIINQRLAKFRLSCNSLSLDYFMRLFCKSSFYSTFVELNSRGSIILNLTKQIVSDMPVPYPLNTEEQKKIASFLDAKCSEIDALMAEIQAQIETLEQYKQSVISEAVTKGLDPNVEMKDSGIEWIRRIPKHWAVDKIKFHLNRNEPKNPGNVQILSVYREYGVVPKDSRDDNHNVTSEDTSKYKYVRPGDLVINKMKAWQGSLAVSEYEGIVSPAYFIFNFTSSAFNKKYFHYLMRSCYKDEFRRISGGIREGQWDLPADDFANELVLLPPVKEQNSIVAHIDSKRSEIEACITTKKEQLSTLESYKKSLIYEYVTGKKEVMS